MKRLLVFGAGGAARSLAEAVHATGEFSVAGFLDAYPELVRVLNFSVLGGGLADFVIVAIGNNVVWVY